MTKAAWRVVIALALCVAATGCSPAAPRTTSGVSSTSATTPAPSVSTTSAASVPTATPIPPGLHHPAVGTAERKAILDGLRPSIERDLGQKVIFEVHKLTVQDGFAFADVIPRTPDGGKIDYLKTRHAAEARDGVFDGGSDAPVYALVRYENGAWRVVTFVIGPTDVAYAGWWQEYGAPKAIFPYTE